MNQEKFQIGMDLTTHLRNRISDICMQASDISPDLATAIGAPVSACMLVIIDILEGAEDAGGNPNVIQTYREQVASRILGSFKGSAVIDKDGVHPLQSEDR